MSHIIWAYEAVSVTVVNIGPKWWLLSIMLMDAWTSHNADVEVCLVDARLQERDGWRAFRRATPGE